jgi:hypothetical protein
MAAGGGGGGTEAGRRDDEGGAADVAWRYGVVPDGVVGAALNASLATGARGFEEVVRGGGCEPGPELRGDGPSAGPLRARLYSRQQVGQRHSTTSVPSADLYRVRRQPNCALMSV